VGSDKNKREQVENVSYILDISEESLKLELKSSSMGSSGPGFVSILPSINNICFN
jgi:hypothetical protein